MLNQIIVVGRLVRDPELKETANGNKVTNITLEVDRGFRNSEGLYESDYITCTLWKGIAESCVMYCQENSIIGVKGRLQSRTYENKEGTKIYTTEVIAERVTFISDFNRFKNNEK